MPPIVLFLTIALLSVWPAVAQTVVDGDTIKLDGTTWRLWGIDAPEMQQTCADGWAAGIEAKRALEALMAEREVACESRGHDRYGRTIGLCRADGQDLGAAMVSAGMAWAFIRYSRDYVVQESAAVAANLGVHALRCIPAWEWRAQKLVHNGSASERAPGCLTFRRAL